MTKKQVRAAVASLGMLAAAATSAHAYTPQVFDATKMTGQDFTAVPMNTSPLGSGGINRAVWSNIWGSNFWFGGPSTGLWITSSAAAKWPNTGMMQATTSCAAGFGYGDFHWRAQIANGNQGPGENIIMWPADGDAAWPGVIKGSSDNHIGEVDVTETNYARNGTSFSTLHFYNGSASGNNGQIMHLPITFPVGDMTTMHDYDEVWGPGSLVLKVDGVVQMTAPPTQVRADYAHGGCNYTLGAQMAMQATGYDLTPTVGLYLANSWWSATDGSAGSGTSVPITQPVAPAAPVVPGVPVTPVTPAAPTTPAVPVAPVEPLPPAAHSAPLSITSVGYTNGVLSAVLSQGVAGGIRYAIDGKYAGVLRDSSTVGTHNVSAAVKPPSTHTVTFYINGAETTSAVTGSFTVP